MGEPQESTTAITQSLNDLFTDLQNCLVVKSLTQYISLQSGDISPSAPVTKLPRDKKWKWRYFLEQLCALCHRMDIATTVTAIVVPFENGIPTLRVATNDPKLTQDAVNHVISIWKLLKQATTATQDGRNEFAIQICNASIKRSSRRICDYWKDLQNALISMREHTGDDDIVSHGLRRFLDVVKDHANLVHGLEQFESTPAYKLLYQLRQTNVEPYRSAWHLIGRLSLWKRAATFIVSQAAKFQEVIAAAKIVAVDQRLDLLSRPIQVATTVRDAFDRVYGRNHPISQSAAVKLAFAQSLLKKEQREQKQDLHAEIAAAQHCSAPGLRFAFDDPYISCSKPCCYACDMYLQLHPRRFSRRPTHGNAWFRWSIAQPLGGMGLSERETATMLRAMAHNIRVDVARCVLGNLYGRRQAFESTTGMLSRTLEI